MIKLLISLLLLLLAACGRKSSESPAEAGTAHSGPLAAHLDFDGFRVSLGDGAYLWEAAHPNWEILIDLLAILNPEDLPPEDEARRIAILRELPEILGLHEIAAYGHSTRHRDPSGYLSRFALQVPDTAGGILWQMEGATTDLADRIRRLPADSSLIIHLNTDLRPVIDNIETLARAAGADSEDLAEAEVWFAENRDAVQTVAAAFRRGATLAITVKDDESFPTLIPGLPSIPLVEMALLVPDPDGALTRLAAHIMSTAAPTPLSIRMVDNVQVLSFPLPLIEDKGMKLAQIDGMMALTSTMDVMQELLDRRGGDQDAPMLARLIPGAPARVENAVISDGRVPGFILEISRAMDGFAEDLLSEEERSMLNLGNRLIEQFLDPLPFTMIRHRESDLHLSILTHESRHLIPGGLHIEPKLLYLFGATVTAFSTASDFLTDFD